MQMEDTRFAIIIASYMADAVDFVKTLESAKAVTWHNMEIVVMDASPGSHLDTLSQKVMDKDYRLKYRKVRNATSASEALNEGFRQAQADWYVILSLQDNIGANALEKIAEEAHQNEDADIIYSDHDETDNGIYKNPYFLPDYNIELLRHTNYIGETFAVRASSVKKLGLFSENMLYAFSYDYLLRADERHARVCHIPALLWHRRVSDDKTVYSREYEEAVKRSMHEHITTVEASFRRQDIHAEVRPAAGSRWNIRYDRSGFDTDRSHVMILHDKNIRVLTTKAQARLYSYVRRPDVAIAGCRIMDTAFRIDNCGFIFDTDGMVYPACYQESIFANGLYDRIVIPQEVSMVDMSYCMIDRDFYKKCGGFDSRLTGRDMILDLCFKARAGGLKVIYTPEVTAVRTSRKEIRSSEESHRLLMERWSRTIGASDPFYNRNLTIGLQNYKLY